MIQGETIEDTFSDSSKMESSCADDENFKKNSEFTETNDEKPLEGNLYYQQTIFGSYRRVKKIITLFVQIIHVLFVINDNINQIIL